MRAREELLHLGVFVTVLPTRWEKRRLTAVRTRHTVYSCILVY